MSTKCSLLPLCCLVAFFGLAPGCTRGVRPAAAPAAQSAPAVEASLRLVVLGDRTGSIEPGALEAAVAQARNDAPDLVLNVGDLVEGYTDDLAELARQWQEVESALAPLAAPVHFCPGNHDVSNDAIRQLMLQRHPTPTGQTWYSFDFRGCHFIMLDPTTFDTTPATQPAQLAFLESDLPAASAARHTFIFMHQPNFTGPLFRLIKTRLDPARTTLFSGHTHQAAFARRDGFDWYILPPTATRSANVPALGDFRAITTVELPASADAKPTVTFVTDRNLRLAGGYLPLEVLEKRQAAVQGFDLKLTPAEDRTWHAQVLQPNPTDQPLIVSLAWLGRGSDSIGRLEIQPGETATRDLGSLSLEDGRPILVRRYHMPRPPGVPAGDEFDVQTSYTLPRLVHAQRITNLAVDGDTLDWSADAAPPAVVDQPADVRTDAFAWDGPADLSFTARVGFTPTQVALAVAVRDDTVQREAAGSAWHSDAVLLTLPKTDTSPAVSAMIVIPPQGGRPEISWLQPQAGVPGAEAAVKRTAEGYVLELALPFAGLGYSQPPRSGDLLRMDLALRDRDKSTGLGPITQMWLSGGYSEIAPVGQPAIVLCPR